MSCCKKYYILKVLLFTYSCFFLTLGGLILAIGIYAEVERQRHKTLEGEFLAPAILLILQGLVMFVVSFIGALGSLRDNIILLKIFMYTLVVFLVLELIGGIVALIIRSKAKSIFNKNIRRDMKNYYDDLDFKNIMDYVQKKLQCCGVADYKDWEVNMYHNCSAPGPLACGVPFTCCITSNPNEVVNSLCGSKALTRDDVANIIYTRGCTDAFLLWVEDNYKKVGGLLLGIILPQIWGIVWTFFYLKEVEDRKDNSPSGKYRPRLLKMYLPN